MFSLLAIPIVSQATKVAADNYSFFAQPIDVILYDLLIWFGWIPIVITLGWGFSEMWLNDRRGHFVSRLKFTILAIDVPIATEQTPKALENLFASLYALKSTITWKEKWMDGKLNPVFSFEIISSEGHIQFLVRTQTHLRDAIEAGIYANYPEAEISEVKDYARDYPNEFPNNEYDMWGTEFTLENEDIYPIRTHLDFEDRISQEIKDPLAVTLEQMAKMRPGEHLWIQILVQPSNNDWQKKSITHVSKIYGVTDKPNKSAFLSAIDSTVVWPSGMLEQATGIDLSGLLGTGEEKVDDPWKVFKISLHQKEEAEAVFRKSAKIGLGCKIRVLYVARKNAFVKVERAGIVKSVFNQFANLNLNKFQLYIPQVPKDDYFWMRWVYTKKQHRLMIGYQNRSWGIGATPVFLNIEELATIWHFPPITIKAPLVKKSESKRAEPPSGLPITFSEETLPGYIPHEYATDTEGLPVIFEHAHELNMPPHELAFEQVSDEPLPQSLPHPSAPTQKELEDDQTTEDDSVPMNLPT